MRTRIIWLVAATTSAVVVAFVVPLCLLVQGVARDRALNRASDQAQRVATLLISVDNLDDLDRSVTGLSSEGPRVLIARSDDTVVGAREVPAESMEAIARARSSTTAFTKETSTGIDVLVPVITEIGTDVVLAHASESDLRAGVARAWLVIGSLGALLIAAAIALARELSRRISVPVTDLAEVAHRLRGGDIGARATQAGPPEVAELGGALNQLAERIEDLIAAERENVADLGHRLRTPVTALRLDTDLVADDGVADRLRDHVDHLQRSIDAVVRDARRPVREPLPAATDVCQVVRTRGDFWRPLAEDQERALTIEVPTATPAYARIPEQDLEELLDTLLDNVFAHTPEGAPVAVRVHTGPSGVVIDVADGGPGLPDGPPQRGSSGSGSTGLGLDIVARIARQAGGQLHLRKSYLGGLSATVSLPLAPPPEPEGGEVALRTRAARR